jgi:hypothetical protein
MASKAQVRKVHAHLAYKKSHFSTIINIKQSTLEQKEVERATHFQ